MKRWFVLLLCLFWMGTSYIACGPTASDEKTKEIPATVEPTGTKDAGTKDEGTKDEGTKDEGTVEKAPDKTVPATPCEKYCANATANCSGGNKIYPDKASCMAACKNIPEGKEGDTKGNTVYCRVYHSGAPAKGDPDTHCRHAGVSSSGGVCGGVCDAYCDQVMANCTGSNAQFKDKPACMKWCGSQAEGDWTDTTGNTIACRAYHASFPSAKDPKTHCPHAGSSGGGVCVGKPKACDEYCNNLSSNCTGKNSVYPDNKSCLAACKNMPEGTSADTKGNTAYCRAYHSGAPAKGAPDTHCPHAGISSSGGVCGGVCEAYCDQVTANCTGANAQYADKAECMTWCKGKPEGKWDDKAGNTIACRAYHASFPAAADPKAHCGHAGKTGDSVCVDTAPKACALYCDNIAVNCQGANSPYPDKGACMAACKSMPEGKSTDKGGNTAYCRAYHSGAPAKGDAKTHCPHAGISSDSGVCGTPCEAYCDQVTANCTGANKQYADKAECMTWCKGKPNGKWDDKSGNTIACRAYHASFPAAADPKTHCPHAGKTGAGVCVDKTAAACTTYCDNVTANCKGGNQVYADKATCMSVCKNMPEGKPADKGGNTAYCRAYHSGTPAKGAPATHCPHAGISSDSGVCGTPCEAYCDQVTANCTGANAQHADKAACMTWCKGKPVGKWDDTGGDTIACRAYHASFPAAKDPKTHCPHAGKSGGGVCGNAAPTFKCKKDFAGCTTYVDRTASGANREIVFVFSKYTPKCIKIKAGQTIKFSGSFMAHPLKAACEEKATIAFTRSGSSYSTTFGTAGYYNYYCTFHGGPSGSGMAGNIWVVP